MARMKPATHGTTARLAPLEAKDSVDLLYGCLKDLPGDPIADLETEHRAEIEADERRPRHGR
jgi:hypothetical protein